MHAITWRCSPRREGGGHLAYMARILAVGLLGPAPGGVAQQVHAHRAGEGGARGPQLGADGLADALLQAWIERRAPGHRHRERGGRPEHASPGSVREVEARDAQPIDSGRGPSVGVVAAASQVGDARPERQAPHLRQPSFSSRVISATRASASRRASAPRATRSAASSKGVMPRTLGHDRGPGLEQAAGEVHSHPRHMGTHRCPPGSLIVSTTDSSRASPPTQGPTATHSPRIRVRRLWKSDRPARARCKRL